MQKIQVIDSHTAGEPTRVILSGFPELPGHTLAEQREALAGEAVSLMLRVPLACDLGQVVPQLAYLRAVQALVDLPLRVRELKGWLGECVWWDALLVPACMVA